ncbi:hypothetical protein [Dactylosporangium sp. NPDC006015]|uniref:hypothetical protein n=1 Tax=Dactylosporangium sp. NPDC006015 TaxID=3154576 RepID=UPI0033B44680
MTPARSRQLSLFGVEARPPTPMDLEGLLAGAGEVGRMGGTAKVSIEVEDAWRADVLRAECEQRGLVVSCEPTGVEDRWTVRTAYAALLAPLAARWLDGTAKVSPPDLVLDGRRLRLWVAAAGSWDGQRAYLLRLAPSRPALTGEDVDPEAADDQVIPFDPSGDISEMSGAGGGTDADGVGAGSEARRTGRSGTGQGPAGAADVGDAGDDGSAAAGVEAVEGASGKPRAGDGAESAGDEGLDEIEDLPGKPRVKAKKKAAPLISGFDPGPVDLGVEVEDWVDDVRDEWPDSGVADLPTVELDAVTEPPAEAPAVPTQQDKTDETSINRRIADNWVAIGDALSAVGLIAVFVGPKAGGPAYRIVGLRRVTRLAELVGEPPAGAPNASWPR